MVIAIGDEGAANFPKKMMRKWFISPLSFKTGCNLAVVEPDSVQRETREPFRFSPFGFRAFRHYSQQARKSDETQDADKRQSSVPDYSNPTPLHPPTSEEHGMPDKAEPSQSNVSDEDSNLTPLKSLKYRKRGVPDKAEERRASSHSLSYGTAALVLSLLTFTTGMCPVSGTMCDEQAMEVSKGEVAIVCRLTSDVYQTKQSVVIQYRVNTTTYPEDALECDWLPSELKIHCLQTPFRTELIAIQPDRVLARLPKDRLKNGTYRCQLVPPDPEPFTDCDICDPDDAEDFPTTEAPETLPTTLGHREVGGTKENTSACSDEPKPQISVRGEGGQHGGLVAAVVILSVIVFCLLLAMAAMVVFFLRYSRMIPGRNQNRRRRPVEAEVRLRDLHETLHT